MDVWRRKFAQGDVIVVRYADDIVLGFQHQAEADRFLKDLRERLGMFGLFGRFAEQNRNGEERVSLRRSTFWGFTQSAELATRECERKHSLSC